MGREDRRVQQRRVASGTSVRARLLGELPGDADARAPPRGRDARPAAPSRACGAERAARGHRSRSNTHAVTHRCPVPGASGPAGSGYERDREGGRQHDGIPHRVERDVPHQRGDGGLVPGYRANSGGRIAHRSAPLDEAHRLFARRQALTGTVLAPPTSPWWCPASSRPASDMQRCSASMTTITPRGLQGRLQGVGDLHGQPLLHLRSAGEAVDDAGDLGQSGDVTRRRWGCRRRAPAR